MNLYERDYNLLTEDEAKLYLALNESPSSLLGIRGNNYPNFPDAIRHHMSLFPNNHIDLIQMRAEGYDMVGLNDRFSELVHADSTKELDVLKFINKQPAYHIIGSILSSFRFGHHEAYLFPEFQLGAEKKDSMRPDYLLVGKGSGGYEFVFVELEKSIGRITLQGKHLGECYRKGKNQVNDWKKWLPGYFSTDVTPHFEATKNPDMVLPEEFKRCDPTRYHYVVIAGLRDDYTDEIYQERRRIEKEENIYLLHYDNLCDYAKELCDPGRLTF